MAQESGLVRRTEAKAAGGGLTRRAGDTVKTIFDESAPPGARAVAGLKTVGVSAAAVTSLVGIDATVFQNPAFMSAAGPGLATALAVGGATSAISGLAWVTCPDHREYGQSIGRFYRRAGLAGGLGGAAAGLAALGAEGLNLEGLHAAAPEVGIFGLAAVAGATLWGVGRTWGRIWAGPKPPPRMPLGE